MLLREPIWADDCQKNIAYGHLGVQMAREVDPGRNVVDVHEQAVGSERISKSDRAAGPPYRESHRDGS